MSNKQKQKIKKIKNQIVNDLKSYKPQRVLLFGSHAWGKPTKDSDIDLLIIKDSRKLRHKRIDEVLNLIYKKKYFTNDDRFPGPIDIIVLTPNEIKKRLQQGDFFIKKIIKKGEVLV